MKIHSSFNKSPMLTCCHCTSVLENNSFWFFNVYIQVPLITEILWNIMFWLEASYCMWYQDKVICKPNKSAIMSRLSFEKCIRRSPVIWKTFTSALINFLKKYQGLNIQPVEHSTRFVTVNLILMQICTLWNVFCNMFIILQQTHLCIRT